MKVHAVRRDTVYIALYMYMIFSDDWLRPKIRIILYT